MFVLFLIEYIYEDIFVLFSSEHIIEDFHYAHGIIVIDPVERSMYFNLSHVQPANTI